ncbi:MAG: hypothetical protein ACJ8G2_12030 [Burkholderiales bacterium]
MKATSLALDHLLRAAGDPIADLNHIGPGHAEFDLAQIIRAGVGVLAKSPDAFPAIAQAIRPVGGLLLSPAMRAHHAAAEAWLSGNPVLAAERYEAILKQWPRDVLALRLTQSCYFFLGWHERFCTILDEVIPAWMPDAEGLDFVLAMASFAHAENGNAAYAEVLGRKALAKDPACPVGVHAVAHAMAESGRPLEGAQWMRAQRAHWAGDSRMRTHNAWHLAMFDVEEGNIAPALNILDAWLLPASTLSSIEACDAAALLWRLATEGVDVASRWCAVSDAFEQTLSPGFWPYVDLHAALAHIAAGKPARSKALTDAIERCAQGSNYAASRARHITLPGFQALHAWAEGRYGEAAKLLRALQPLLPYAGGSRVQLEIFKSIERKSGNLGRTAQHHQPRKTLPKIPAMREASAGRVSLRFEPSPIGH